MILKIMATVLCPTLFMIGGLSWHDARRFMLPVVLWASLAITLYTWWFGFFAIPTAAVLCIGYGPKSILYKYLTDAGARGAYMFLAAVTIGTPLLITGHLNVWIYLSYCIISGVLGATLRNLQQICGDLIFGAFLASVIWIVHP